MNTVNEMSYYAPRFVRELYQAKLAKMRYSKSIRDMSKALEMKGKSVCVWVSHMTSPVLTWQIGDKEFKYEWNTCGRN